MIRESDILFYAAGAALEKHGTLLRRTTTPRRGGEKNIETFARTGTARYLGRDGKMYTAAANTPRVEFVDLDGDGISETPTALLEAARTNALTRSEELDHADWTKTACSITQNADTAPDGTSTADRIVEDGTTASHTILQSRAGVNSDQDIALSCFALVPNVANTRTWIRLAIDESGGTDYIRQWYNLGTGVLGSNDTGGTGVFRRARIVVLGESWYWCSLVASPQNGTSIVRQFVALATGDLVTSYAGDGVSVTTIWGVQVEQDAPHASSYIQTVAAAATRNAETLSFAYYRGAVASVLYADFIEDGQRWISPAINILRLGGASDPQVALRKASASTGYEIIHRDAASNQVSGTVVTPTPSLGDRVELRGILFADGSVQLGLSLNGGSETLGTQSAALALPTGGWAAATAEVGLAGFSHLHKALVVRNAPAISELRAA